MFTNSIILTLDHVQAKHCMYIKQIAEWFLVFLTCKTVSLTGQLFFHKRCPMFPHLF